MPNVFFKGIEKRTGIIERKQKQNTHQLVVRLVTVRGKLCPQTIL